MDVLAQPHSGTDVVAFTVALIALMFAVFAYREREPGMAWLAAGYVVYAALAGLNDRMPPDPQSALPNGAFLGGLYLARLCCAVGLVGFTFPDRRQRVRLLLALTLPTVLAAVLLGLGVPLRRSVAVLPLIYLDIGLALVCLQTARRQVVPGFLLLAMACLIGPALLMGDIFHSAAALRIRYDYAWPGAIGFGIMTLLVSALRKSHDSQLADARARRTAGFLTALSRANQAIVRTPDAQSVFQSVCQACVDTGQALMACVYVGNERELRRVAEAGPAEQILLGFPNPWPLDSPEARRSLTVRATVEGVRILANDYQNEPLGSPWRERARQHGVHAIAWFPILRGGRPHGALMLCASQLDFFDDPVVRLLDDLAQDISFALDNVGREAERVAALREAQLSLERFTRLFDAAPVAAAIVELTERRILAANDILCQRYGLPREQIVGQTTASLPYGLVPEDRERVHEELRRLGRVRNLLAESRATDGAKRAELINVEPIEHLGQACMLLMSMDVTEMRAAEETRRALMEAQAASRTRMEFLSRMSHELRTPLNAMLGFSALLRRDAASRLTETDTLRLDHIQTAGSHLLKLINDLLDLSRIEAGQFRIEKRRVDLGEIAAEAIHMSGPLAQQHGVTLQSELQDSHLGVVEADPTRLRQVVLNLISNAIKYNRQEGSVHVRGFVDFDGQVGIEVVDTGLGMTPEQLESLFQPFDRLGRENSAIEGCGIGCALSKELMTMMGGDLRIQSEPGRGTRASLWLPRGSQGLAEVTATRSAELDETEVPPEGVVLYIEDDTVNTILVEQLLSAWKGVELICAEDGGKGLQLARALKPDLVLLDMNLPDMSGIDVLDQLQADAALRDIPVVVLSASVLERDIVSARAHGAASYCAKPLDYREFLATVAHCMASSGQGREASAVAAVSRSVMQEEQS